MLNLGQKVTTTLAVLGLVLAGLGMAVEESLGAAAVFFLGLLLVSLLTAVLVQRLNEALNEQLEMQIKMLRQHACCGCGHKLSRHRDPKSADGYGCLDCNCQAVHRLDEGMVE